MNIAVILAGGIGARVGANCPKQFIEIEGKPIIAYTLDVFQNVEYLASVYGDWRKLSSEEKRVSNHDFYELDLNKSYLERT